VKLLYARLPESMQTEYTRLPKALTSKAYDLTLISNLRVIRVSHESWKGGVVDVPVERFENFSLDPEALAAKAVKKT